MLGYMSLPDSTPQRCAAAIPGIKLSDLVNINKITTKIYYSLFSLFYRVYTYILQGVHKKHNFKGDLRGLQE
jgi:hypothetical protein